MEYKFTEQEKIERENLDQLLSDYYRFRFFEIKDLDYNEIDLDELEAIIDAGLVYGWLS